MPRPRPRIRRRSLPGHCQSPPYSSARSVGHIRNLGNGNSNELMGDCPPGQVAYGASGDGSWGGGGCVDIQAWID